MKLKDTSCKHKKDKVKTHSKTKKRQKANDGDDKDRKLMMVMTKTGHKRKSAISVWESSRRQTAKEKFCHRFCTRAHQIEPPEANYMGPVNNEKMRLNRKQGNYSLRRPPKLIIPQAVIRH